MVNSDTGSMVAGSMISAMTSKSKSGAVNKHCNDIKCGAKLISGINWSTHVKRVHGGEEDAKKNFTSCIGLDCAACL